MKAKIEIFDGYGQGGEIIKSAACTCYRSEEKTQRTADDFIKMLKANKHMSMLEFSWFPVLIDFSSVEERNKAYNSLLELKLKYIEFYTIYDSRILLYGNGRAWLDFFNHDLVRYDENYLNLVVHISKALNAVNSKLFETSFDDFCFKTRAICLNETYYKNNSVIFLDNWVAVKFSNVSRGFTHEIVRSRTMSFAQASTRYINNSNFDFILGNETGTYYQKVFTFNDKIERWLKDTKELYSHMIEHGIKKDVVRQILPIGIANEICVAGTIKNWKHIFELRCSPSAHWEIREVMEELKKEFEERGLLQ